MTTRLTHTQAREYIAALLAAGWWIVEERANTWVLTRYATGERVRVIAGYGA
jgi:hypothetical protein